MVKLSVKKKRMHVPVNSFEITVMRIEEPARTPSTFRDLHWQRAIVMLEGA
jgi:hypothetical protein